ncbi:MAG: trimeric intracellular cation channel family protein [Spirochaetia bacterium]
MLRPEAQLSLNILDIIGAFAFSISGALSAIKSRMDYFGIFLLACVTTFGGGVIRDLLLGTPPRALFATPHYLLICIFCTILVMIVASHHIETYMPLILIFDAIGLAVFSASGTLEGIKAHAPWYTAIIMAVLTGCGGGVLRDILRSEKPVILYSDFYAGLSMLGSLILLVIYHGFGQKTEWGVTACCIFIFVMRMLILYPPKRKNSHG